MAKRLYLSYVDSKEIETNVSVIGIDHLKASGAILTTVR